LEVIHEFLFSFIVEQRGVQDAALRANWRRARRRLGKGITTLEENMAEKHPKTFLVLFIVPLLQAVKIFAVDGIFWTKVWAGIYLSSYVVLAVAGFLAPSDWRKTPPEELDAGAQTLYRDSEMRELILSGVSLGLHAFICSWVVY
jgi:hypothetical protein